MTEKDNKKEMEPEITTQPTEQAEPEANEHRPAADGGNSGAGISILALLISLAAVAGAGYLWFHQQGANAAVSKLVESVEQDQNAAQEKMSALSAELDAEKDQTSKALSEAGSKQAALENSVKQIYIDISNNRDVWKLEEVDQLLTVAGERMQLANDKKTALAALQLADKRLATMGDPALLPLREKVSDAISQLKAVGEDDVSGVALKIRSLMKQVDSLPFDYDRTTEKTSLLLTPVKVFAADESPAEPQQADVAVPQEQTVEEVSTPAESGEASSESAENTGAEAAAETITVISDSVESQAEQPDTNVVPTVTEQAAPEEAVENASEQPQIESPAATTSSAESSLPVAQKLKQGASQFFNELWDDTLKAFDYQVLDRAAKPLLAPDQKYFVTENVKLALGAAQLAALQGDEVTYKDNLEKARDWISKYFAADNSQVKSAADTIAELEKVDVSPEWPDISGVLQELRVIKERKAGQ